ncbi:hypothetical protein [Serratia marcescens]|uniref:hypothetical protein n=1 Tax=Serratia marcescens TaxID=615 RepID=UPI001865ED1E|nr:hypothetical protein [Serratia marcescens]
MTVATTEELKHLASSDNTNELTRRLARECLANREAQPVALDVIAKFKEWNTGLPVENLKADYVIGWVLANYYAMPAPAVVKLPTEFYSDEGIVVRLEQVMAALAVVGVKYERKGGACRAAMLAQPVSSGYKLPPHVYRELVNCLRDTAVKYQGAQQLRAQLSRTLTENGLVASAPEGGNDHNTGR